jgi:hypothetical protein
MRHHGWIRHFVKDFEYNHLWQFRFHLVMMTFWILNAAAGTVVLILWPAEWVKVGVFYVFLLSIYANWDTDYDAVSASQAALHAQTIMRQRGETDQVTDT